MGSSSASCRSATIRRPAAYKAAALPAELRRRNRSGMRNGGWAMRAKEFLSRDRLMPPIANYLPFGNPAFRMAAGPIVLRRDSNPHHPKNGAS